MPKEGEGFASVRTTFLAEFLESYWGCMIVGEHHFFCLPSSLLFPRKQHSPPRGPKRKGPEEKKRQKRSSLASLASASDEREKGPMLHSSVRKRWRKEGENVLGGTEGGKQGRKTGQHKFGSERKTSIEKGKRGIQVLHRQGSWGASSTSTIYYCSLNQSSSLLWQVDVLTLEFTFWPPPRWPPSLPWRRRWPP